MFRAHIERTQMTQTFQGPQPLPDTVIFFCGRNCSLAACFCVAVLLHYCQLPVKCFCRVAVPSGTLDWQLAVMYFLFDTVLNTYIICHHTPYKTCQFSCYGCYGYISLFPSPYHLIILLSQPYISFIRVCYDFCGISRLPCTQHL